MPDFWHMAGALLVLAIVTIMLAIGADKHPEEK